MEAIINKNINRLISQCKIRFSDVPSGSHTIKFECKDDYWSDRKIADVIDDKMMIIINRLEAEAGKHFQFGYEIDEAFDEWVITLEWTSSNVNPFDDILERFRTLLMIRE